MPGLPVEVRAAVTVLDRAPGRPVLDGVDLSVAAGGRHGIVGGSGSGKTTLGRIILGRALLRSGSVRVGDLAPPGTGRAGRLAFAASVGHVPQDAVGSLDPSWPVWRSVVEPLRLQGRADAARSRAAGLFRDSGLDKALLDRLPRELSGGECQRVCIARAMACGPGLVVADEPTSALDPLVQAQVLDLVASAATAGTTVVLIAHRLRLVRARCDTVTVLCEGRVVEAGPVDRVLADPRHPHTRALIDAEG